MTYLRDYALRFDDLSSDQAQRIAAALHLPEFDDPDALPPLTGRDLYEMCDAAELDHASVVLSLRDDATVTGVRAIETLIGKPIQRRSATPPGASPDSSGSPRGARNAPRQRSSHSSKLPCPPTAVVLTVVPNPKRPGSASAMRFENWRPGITVADALAAGLTPGDVAWDLAHGFVTVEEPK